MRVVNKNKNDKKALGILNKCSILDDVKIDLFKVEDEDRNFLINYIMNMGEKYIKMFLDNLNNHSKKIINYKMDREEDLRL